VNVPSLADGGTATIYAYYGNLSAGSLSNGDSTFDFFDGFDSSGIDTNKWNVIDSTGFAAANGYLRGSNTTGRIASIKTFSSGVVQEEKVKTQLIAANGSMMGGFTYLQLIISAGSIIQPLLTIETIQRGCRKERKHQKTTFCTQPQSRMVPQSIYRCMTLTPRVHIGT